MATYNSELETELRNYIDSLGRRRERLRELLKNESVEDRYCLLINVTGEVYSTRTGIHSAVIANDLESVKCMLDEFSSNRIYDVVKIQSGGKWTALHTAAYRDYTSIINYLLNNLSQQQKYDLLKIQDENGNPALHTAVN